MELISTLLIAIIVILALFLTFKIIKKTLKFTFAFIFIVLIMFAGAAYFGYQDYKDIKQNFISNDKLILFQKGGSMIAGFVVKNRAVTKLKEELRKDYSSRGIHELLNQNIGKRVIIINIDKEKDKESKYKSEESDENNLMSLVQEKFLNLSLDKQLIYIKTKGIEVYPKTAFVMLSKYMPDFMIKMLIWGFC